MTSRSYTDGDDVPSVKTAWSAAKREVLTIAAHSAFASFFATAVGFQLSTGHPLMAAGPALLGIGNALQAVGAYGRLSSKLSQLPAPKP